MRFLRSSSVTFTINLKHEDSSKADCCSCYATTQLSVRLMTEWINPNSSISDWLRRLVYSFLLIFTCNYHLSRFIRLSIFGFFPVWKWKHQINFGLEFLFQFRFIHCFLYTLNNPIWRLFFSFAALLMKSWTKKLQFPSLLDWKSTRSNQECCCSARKSRFRLHSRRANQN